MHEIEESVKKKRKQSLLRFRNPLVEVTVLLDFDATPLGNWFPDAWRQRCCLNLTGRNFQDEGRRRYVCLNIWIICDKLPSDTPSCPRGNDIDNCRLPTRGTIRKTDKNVRHNFKLCYQQLYTECPKKVVPFSKIFLWALDVILESFLYQKLGNKSKFFFYLTKIQYGSPS